jgi:hypothetical protein
MAKVPIEIKKSHLTSNALELPERLARRPMSSRIAAKILTGRWDGGSSLPTFL